MKEEFILRIEKLDLLYLGKKPIPLAWRYFSGIYAPKYHPRVYYLSRELHSDFAILNLYVKYSSHRPVFFYHDIKAFFKTYFSLHVLFISDVSEEHFDLKLSI